VLAPGQAMSLSDAKFIQSSDLNRSDSEHTLSASNLESEKIEQVKSLSGGGIVSHLINQDLSAKKIHKLISALQLSEKSSLTKSGVFYDNSSGPYIK